MSKVAVARQRPFRMHPRAAERRASAIRVADALLASAGEIEPGHLRELLSIAVWKMTEADGGKQGCRYRSAAALVSEGKVQHDHVVTRKSIVNDLLEHPDRCSAIMSNAVGCLVTAEEHHRLSQLRAEVRGWDRYRQAAIEV